MLAWGDEPAPQPQAVPVVGHVDLHAHLAGHLASDQYGRGPVDDLPRHPNRKHRFRQQMFAEAIPTSGTVLFVTPAYVNPVTMGFRRPESIARTLTAQLDYVESFAAASPDVYTVAHTPTEARQAIALGRVVFVLALEGATKVLDGPGDAAPWAARGVAVVTPIHLADSPLGGATHTDLYGWFLNTRASLRDLFHPRREPPGLTSIGAAVVDDLTRSGILVDLTHMSAGSVDDTLAIVSRYHVPPLMTHGAVQGVHDEPHALSDARILEVYRRGGLVGIAGNADGASPLTAYWETHPRPLDYCRESIDDFALHYRHVVALTAGAPVGWGSDWNGGVDHFRPKYGPHGCHRRPSDGREVDSYDTDGLVHIGALPEFTRHLGMQADLAPLDASAERFLQMWEAALTRAPRSGPP
jgi:microsomal dipeptidase-like Zn-dependent dipeptidase